TCVGQKRCLTGAICCCPTSTLPQHSTGSTPLTSAPECAGCSCSARRLIPKPLPPRKRNDSAEWGLDSKREHYARPSQKNTIQTPPDTAAHRGSPPEIPSG